MCSILYCVCFLYYMYLADIHPSDFGAVLEDGILGYTGIGWLTALFWNSRESAKCCCQDGSKLFLLLLEWVFLSGPFDGLWQLSPCHCFKRSDWLGLLGWVDLWSLSVWSLPGLWCFKKFPPSASTSQWTKTRWICCHCCGEWQKIMLN